MAALLINLNCYSLTNPSQCQPDLNSNSVAMYYLTKQTYQLRGGKNTRNKFQSAYLQEGTRQVCRDSYQVSILTYQKIETLDFQSRKTELTFFILKIKCRTKEIDLESSFSSLIFLQLFFNMYLQIQSPNDISNLLINYIRQRLLRKMVHWLLNKLNQSYFKHLQYKLQCAI